MSEENTQTTPPSKEEPVLILRPKYVPAIAYAETAFYSFATIFTITVGGGILLFFIFSLFQLNGIIPTWLPFTLLFAISCIFIPPFIFETIKKNISHTGYKFYKDHILFQHYQVLFFRQRGRLRYADIIDIFERSNIFQSYFNVGNVWILAPGTGIAAGRRFPGLKISDIELDDDLTNFFEEILFPTIQENQAQPQPNTQPPPTEDDTDDSNDAPSPKKKTAKAAAKKPRKKHGKTSGKG